MGRLPRTLIAAATVVCALAIAAIYGGVLSFLADDATVSRDAYWSILTYWALFTVAVLLATAVLRRPAEVALAAASVLVVLVLAEVALRLAGVERAMRPYAGLSSSRFHHVNAPNSETFMGVYDGQPVIIRTNEDGMRSDYSREEFLNHGVRVLVMGDSFVWGMGVRQEDMLASVMERKLRERLGRDDVAVITGANISYSPVLLRKRYREVYRHYRPTVVLLALDASDIGDDIKYLRENVGGDTLRWNFLDERPARFFLAVHQLARPLLARLGHNLMYPYNTFFRPGRSSYDYYEFTLEVDGVAEKNRFFIYRHPLESTRPFFDATKDVVDGIAAEVRGDGARFALVVTPRYHHWSDRESPNNWEVRQYQYTYDDPHEFAYLDYFEGAASSSPYPVVQLLPAFEGTDRFPLVFASDPHWNRSGHDVVGDFLTEFLVERGWAGD
jgi:hypothetical protein